MQRYTVASIGTAPDVAKSSPFGARRRYSRLRVLLSAGLFALWPTGASATEPPTVTVPVRILISTAGGSAETPYAAGQLVVAPLDDVRDVESLKRFPLRTPLGTVDLPRGKWHLFPSAPGVWIEDGVVDVSSGNAQNVTLHAWPGGTVSARLAVAAVESLPREIRIGFRRPEGVAASSGGGDQGPSQGTAVCSVETARVTCLLPEGQFDTRIVAAGFAPVYKWAVSMKREATVSLGTIELTPGGSVMGYLEDQEGQPRSGVRVALFTTEGQAVVRGSYAKGLIGRADIRPLEAITDRRGFFQITGISPGRYRLLARETRGSLASAVAEIRERSETRLGETMVLTSPATVEVVVQPPRPPGYANWTAMLQNVDTAPSEQIIQRLVPESGELRIDALAEGRYVLIVEVEGQRWSAEEVEVLAPTTRFEVNLPTVHVRGRLRLGSAPVAGSVIFGGKQSAMSVQLRSNEDGVFAGYLPRAGVWRVDIEAAVPPIRRSLKQVELKESSDGTYAADISLPGTELKGDVVDDSFQPVGGAVVDVNAMSGEDVRFQMQADAEGRFELWGLPDTPALVSAIAPGVVPLASDSIVVTPNSSGAATRVQIVVRPTKKLRARVVTEGSSIPVVGASVKVTPLGPTPTMKSPLATTDADGRFETLLPPGTQAVDVTFGSKTQSLEMMRITSLDDTEKTLPLARIGGQLLLETGGQTGDQERLIALFHNGAAESLTFLMQSGIASQEGPSTALTPLAPGVYMACFVTGTFVNLGPPPLNTEQCAVGSVMAGGELVLRISGGDS